MKRYLFAILILSVASNLWAAQTAVTQITGTKASVGALKADVNTRLGTIESNRQDHVTNIGTKADASCFATEAAFNGCFDLTWATGGGDDLGNAAFGDVVALWTTCTSGFLKYDGTCEVPTGAAHDAITLGTDAAAILGLTGQEITLDSQTANYIFAAPNGSSGDPTFRALVATDIPTLTLAKVSDAGTAAALDHGTAIGDLMRFTDAGTCSNQSYTTEATCESNSGTWTAALGLPFTIDTADLTDTTNLLGGAAAIADLTDWPSGLTATELGYVDGVTSGIQDQINTLSASSFAPTITAGTPSALAATGPYINSTNNHFIYNVNATGYYDLTGASYTAHAVTPTITSAVIGTDGETLTLNGSASLSLGADADGSGFDVDCTSGTDNAATYVSGAPGTALVYNLAQIVLQSDSTSCNLDYNATGNTIAATTGGAALASITSGAITNNSTQSSGITDAFTTDTSANYTAITGTLSITGGTLGGGTNWANNFFYHETATGSNDHFAQALISASEVTNAGGILGLRSNGTTGYYVQLTSGSERMYFRSFSGATVSDVSYKTITGGITATNYNVKVTVSGSTFHFYIDLNADNDFDDTNEDLGTSTDTTYSTGQYIVTGANRGADGVDYRVDNLSGGTL